METKKILNRGQDRLYVEITKSVKSGQGILPNLQKDDKVLIMSIRDLNEEDLNNLVGKHLKFYQIDENNSFIKFEGILMKNEDKYWNHIPKDISNEDKLEYSIDNYTQKGEKMFVLIDKTYSSSEYEQPILFIGYKIETSKGDYFQSLRVIDLEIKEPNYQELFKIKCSHCQKEILKIDKYCRHCSRYNPKVNKNLNPKIKRINLKLLF